MDNKRLITQICIVVEDVAKANANWSKILGMPEKKIETISANSKQATIKINDSFISGSWTITPSVSPDIFAVEIE